VDYSNFKTEPVVPTAAQFVGTLSASATQINAGETVTFTIGVQNEGDAEGTLQVTFTVKDSQGNIVDQSQRQITVNPSGKKEEQMTVLFSEDGTYTATLNVEGGVSPSPITIQVGVPVGVEWPPVWEETGLTPSPVTSDTATLHIEGAFDSVTLMVFDLSGAKVLEETYTANDASVDLSALDNGVYLYVLVAEYEGDTAKSPVKKLLVQK
jgi:hypothetical protein